MQGEEHTHTPRVVVMATHDNKPLQSTATAEEEEGERRSYDYDDDASPHHHRTIIKCDVDKVSHDKEQSEGACLVYTER